MSLKFFNIDLHIGVIRDIACLLAELGHEVTDWTLSAHAWVLGRERDPVAVINKNNWRQIDFDIGDRFYARYRHELDRYDGFIVTHTPVFSLLYEKWRKPIIVVASTRYECPYYGESAKWARLNQYLVSQIDRGLIIPIANNKYDAAYARLFTKREWQCIPSICDYTGINYAPARDDLLYCSRYKGFLPHPSLFDSDRLRPSRWRRALNRLPIVPKQRGYRWADLSAFKGIVHVPYNSSIMSISEQYAANIPLFFPSIALIEDLYREHADDGILSELSYNKVFGLKAGSVIDAGPSDPNDYSNVPVMMEWARLSDFYDQENMPYLIYFDSSNHLDYQINSIDYLGTSKNMRRANAERKRRALDAWKRVIGTIG